MKIGITERGDAALDLSWVDKIKSNNYDGAILITKNLTQKFIKNVMELHNQNYKLIVHATCTGWGHSVIEPNVPYYHEQLDKLNQLVKNGFPMEQCVLRIDPIIPTTKGLEAVSHVLDTAFELGLLPNMRVRISILDEYKHVKTRLTNMGYATFYPGTDFQASVKQMRDVRDTLSNYDIQFHTCAETKLLDNTGLFVHSGCISDIDLRILGLDVSEQSINPQNRYGCKCLACKTELLENKHRCPHQCAYCYWRD